MRQEERDLYCIPPNFIDSGTLAGGMLKTRNVVEAAILAITIGFPILRIQASLTTRIILLCLTALPAALAAIIGIGSSSLSGFLLQFLRFLHKRRVLPEKLPATKEPPTRKRKIRSRSKMPNWLLEEPISVEQAPSSHKNHKKAEHAHQKKRLHSKAVKDQPPPHNPISTYIPIEKIENGIIYTQDHRYVKIIEILPVNFLLRSAQEQRSIIYSFISYLKIAPAKVQIKVLTKRADIDRHLETVRRELERETDPHCKLLQEDYIHLVQQLGSREAITRRFFLIFEREALPGMKREHEEEDAIAFLQTAARTAANYLRQCGNTVLTPDNEDEAASEILFHILCRKESCEVPFAQKIRQILEAYIADGRSTDAIPTNEFYAPATVDFSHGRYICVDGIYYAYLLVPSDGYKAQVSAGWLSLIVNAGDGVDMDLFLSRQPKDRIIRKLGQQLRINRSKIKEVSDTNTDFDDLDDAIRSGYFLKEGLGNNEDFYYLNLLITITADNPDDLEWKCAEMKKLLVSQDMNVQPCTFCQEQAFLSSLPLASLDRKLFDRSKRNALTLGAASCYPFVSYEMCDDNGILLGVNKHNNSLIIVDIFDARVYKNANIAILGTSGAGKTFTMQLMATRMRRKGIQVFIVAPLKGHELHRACSNIGGEFIQISPASQNCINVLQIRKVDKSVDELLDGPGVEKSMLAAKIQRLHIFFSLLIPDMSHEERQLLDDALIRTYERKGITHDNSTLIDPDRPNEYRKMPILGDLFEVLKESGDTLRLANILNRLVNGSARTFNQQTNVSLDNKYTVLDISELTGDLLTVGMFVALDYVWDKAKQDRTKEKAIFIDECWQLIGASSNRLAAEFVLEIFKIIRGYGGSAICATQDINDFFALDDGRYGKGIINNAKTKILLNLEEEEARRVQTLLHLSEAEVMEITHFARGSGLISTNNNNVTVEVKCSQFEKDLITTDRRELRELLNRAAKQTS